MDNVINNTIIILLLSTTHITPVFMIDSFYCWFPQVFSICITIVIQNNYIIKTDSVSNKNVLTHVVQLEQVVFLNNA